ncbi:hypothetical protein CR513_61226 [Mucuna pruriens]|uniref:Uncharacterized protein n=1 Tax=Mucuna pruriens TaxID=157652 RepID=A0A371E3Q7_MUCPR|nr:hypothetical protein CR513_61226 [Mucuna pruriens]
MASLKAEKPIEKSCCSQPSAGQVKKESAAKPSSGTPKAPASKPAPKKTSSHQLRKKASSNKIVGNMGRVNKDSVTYGALPPGLSVVLLPIMLASLSFALSSCNYKLPSPNK